MLLRQIDAVPTASPSHTCVLYAIAYTLPWCAPSQKCNYIFQLLHCLAVVLPKIVTSIVFSKQDTLLKFSWPIGCSYYGVKLSSGAAELSECLWVREKGERCCCTTSQCAALSKQSCSNSVCMWRDSTLSTLFNPETKMRTEVCGYIGNLLNIYSKTNVSASAQV